MFRTWVVVCLSDLPRGCLLRSSVPAIALCDEVRASFTFLGLPYEWMCRRGLTHLIRDHPPADVHASTPGTRRLLFDVIQSWRDTLEISMGLAFL